MRKQEAVSKRGYMDYIGSRKNCKRRVNIIGMLKDGYGKIEKMATLVDSLQAELLLQLQLFNNDNYETIQS